jgi:hypothetical protein
MTNRRLQGLLANLPRALVYLGLALLVAGCALIAIAWGRTAGLTEVARQTPYLVSTAFPGLGLVIIGMICIHLGIREGEARERSRQNAELLRLLQALREASQRPALPTTTARKTAARKTAARKTAARKTAARKTAARKTAAKADA